MASDTCKFCSCTDHKPCDGGCGWANDDRTVCSVCSAAAEIATELVKILGVVASNPRAGLRLTNGRWEALTIDQQRVLVMTCRATIEGIRAALLESLGQDAVLAGLELNAISGFLFEKCPNEIRDDDSVSSVVMRLLEPHIGSRVVLASGR